MTVTYEQDLTPSQALRRVADMQWARTNFTSAMVVIGIGPFRLGQTEFKRVADMQDRITLEKLKLEKAGTSLSPGGERVILTPQLLSFNFNNGADYLRLMTAVKGEHMVSGTDGSNFVVQTQRCDKAWHDVAMRAHIHASNLFQMKQGGNLIRKVEYPDSDRIDYVFPNLTTLAAFCRYYDSGMQEMLASQLRTQRAQQAQQQAPQPQNKPA